jgi:OOP family OmpA-OmpF porin
VAAPPPPPPPAPPKPRELFTLKGVLFEFDKSTLTKGAKDTLGIAVRYLKDHGDVRVEIQGHTDSKGSDEYNMKLGERRAESVKAYLGTQGISADRVTTRSFGESQPVAENTINGKDNPAGRALNRRVVIIEIP